MQQLLERIELLERQAARRGRRHYWLGALCLLALMLAALLLRPLVAEGEPQSGGLPGLERRVVVLEAANTALQAALAAETAARRAGDAALQTPISNETAARQAGDAALQNQVAPLSSLFLAPNAVNGQPFFQRDGSEITITGANLLLVNGLGATNGNPAHPFEPIFQGGPTAVNGLGNLTIGYNESRTGFGEPDDRRGSHNLVVGIAHNYSRFGGIVVGHWNSISAPYASVSGGMFNLARGDGSSVSGGRGIEQRSDDGWSAGGEHFGGSGIGVFRAP